MCNNVSSNSITERSNNRLCIEKCARFVISARIPALEIALSQIGKLCRKSRAEYFHTKPDPIRHELCRSDWILPPRQETGISGRVGYVSS